MDETQAAAVDANLGGATQLDTPDERVIEIGWQALLLPVLAVAVVVAGWYLGRMIGGSKVVETLPSPSPVVAAPTSQVVVIGPDGTRPPSPTATTTRRSSRCARCPTRFSTSRCRTSRSRSSTAART